LLVSVMILAGSFTGKIIFATEETAKNELPIAVIGGGLPKGIFFGPTYLNIEQQRLYVSDTSNNRIQAFIRGNVFQLAFGGFGQNEREFDRVGGICSNATNVYIVDSGNSRIQIFDSKANYLGQFGSFGVNEGNFRYPTDIAILTDRLYVLDSGNNRVQIFDLTGKFISTFGISGSGNGQFSAPLGIEVAEGKIVVSDTGNNRIQIFDLTGLYQTSFGWFGSEEKAFNQPKGLAYEDGNLYVVDSGNKRIQIFTLSGVFNSVVKFDGFSSPYGIALLDSKILVSDVEQSKIFSLEKDGKQYGYFGSTTESKGRFVKPTSVAVSDNEVFVLDSALKSIQAFDVKEVKSKDKDGKEFTTIATTLLRVFSNAEMEKAGFVNPVSITYFNKALYIVDEKTSKISEFTVDGKFVRSFGKYGSDKGEFIFPNDLVLFGKYMFVTDTGNSRIQILDMDGNFVRSIGTFGNNDGQFLSIKGITVQENRIFVMDSGNARIQMFDFDGNFISKFGKKGFEIGSYNGATGIYSDSSLKLYISDTLNNRIQIFDTVTNQSHVYGRFGSIFQFDPAHPVDSNYAKGETDYDYGILPGSFSYPSDVISFKDYLLVVDTYNVRVQVVPFKKIFAYDTIRLSPAYLDFGTVSTTNVIERKFLIHNESGSLLEGTITSDNPSITVSPSTFKGFNQEITVKVVGDTLEKGKQYNSKLSVVFTSGITKVIDVILKADETPDFYTVVDPLLIASADDDGFKIPIKIIPQNGFSGIVTFIALGLPKNTTTEFEPASVNLPETDTVILKLRPSTKFIEAGIYDIEIEAKAAKSNVTHRAASTFIYKQKLDLVPHTVLGELFTAIWCLNCIHSHYAMDRLFEEMGKEKVAWIEYYVDSTDDHPKPRLSCPESEQRMKWYMSDKGIPNIFFDGTDYIKGIPNLEDDSVEAKRKAMYDAYKKKVIEKSKEPSLVSISARSLFDSNLKTGSVTASISALDNIPFKDPRIYFALTESSIPYVAINSDKMHYFVLRDFITPLNDDLHDYLGTPMKLSSGTTFGKKGDTFQIDVNFKLLDIYNLTNLSLVIFVQDNVTKKVMQTQVYPVKVINVRNFDIVSDTSLTQKRVKGEEATLTSYIRNIGTTTDSYDITIINKSKEKWLYQVYIDGKEQVGSGTGNAGIQLKADGIAKIEVKVNVPGNAEVNAEQQFYIQATSQTSLQTKNVLGFIQIIESRPPDFQFKVEKEDGETQTMAGDSVRYVIKVTPDPVFNDPIKLSIKGDIPELESYKFEPETGTAPFESTLTLVVKPNTPTKDLTISIVASGGKTQKVVNMILSVLINPDAVPPSIDIAYPPENLITNKPEIEVTGMVDPSVNVDINDKPANKEANGSFTLKIQLQEGQNVIKFLAKNRRGLITEISRIVTLDTKPPKLSIDDLDPEVTKDTVMIKGKTEIGAVVSITTTREPSDVPVDSNGEFSFPVKLEKGYNTIEVVAIDPATNSTLLSFDVRYITLIKLRIGSKIMLINEEQKAIDAEPYIKTGRTMVPLRAIAEALGVIPDWNASLREIIINRKGKTIRLHIGSKEAFTKEQGQTGETKIILEAPPEISKGRTFVPLRFVAEALGSEIKGYDSKLKEITIID
jgi:hypothetical protein